MRKDLFYMCEVYDKVVELLPTTIEEYLSFSQRCFEVVEEIVDVIRPLVTINGVDYSNSFANELNKEIMAFVIISGIKNGW